MRYARVQHPYGAWAEPCAFCVVLCGCVLPIRAGCAVIIYTEACALHFPRVCMRYGVCAFGTVFGLGSPSSVYCTCMRVCTAVGMCSPSVVPLVVSTCMCACIVYSMGSLGGVRSVHECLCLYVRTVLVKCLAWTAWAMHRLCVGLRAWACTLCVNSLWHGQPWRRT